jgi:hypothetical protein
MRGVFRHVFLFLYIYILRPYWRVQDARSLRVSSSWFSACFSCRVSNQTAVPADTHTHAHARTHAHTHTHTQFFMCFWWFFLSRFKVNGIPEYVYICIYMHIYTHTQTHTYNSCVFAVFLVAFQMKRQFLQHVCTHTHAHTHTRTHTICMCIYLTYTWKGALSTFR